jgi:hypothetical protein
MRPQKIQNGLARGEKGTGFHFCFKGKIPLINGSWQEFLTEKMRGPVSR